MSGNHTDTAHDDVAAPGTWSILCAGDVSFSTRGRTGLGECCGAGEWNASDVFLKNSFIGI